MVGGQAWSRGKHPGVEDQFQRLDDRWWCPVVCHHATKPWNASSCGSEWIARYDGPVSQRPNCRRHHDRRRWFNAFIARGGMAGSFMSPAVPSMRADSLILSLAFNETTGLWEELLAAVSYMPLRRLQRALGSA